MNLRFRLGQAYEGFRAGDASGLWRRLLNRLHSETLRVGIRMEPTAANEAQAATAENRVRIASEEDIEAVLDPARGSATDANELWQRRLRRHVAATVGPSRCYVADSGDLGPSFMQFLFFPEDNDLLQRALPDLGPPIEPGEAMVDYLYVAPDARSLPFLTSCLLQVAVEARRRGATSVITYTPIGNKAALTTSRLVGYRPFALRRRSYRLFRRRVSYEPYTQDTTSR
jgi:GNAT superfamily N-acetyltransferase